MKRLIFILLAIILLLLAFVFISKKLGLFNDRNKLKVTVVEASERKIIETVDANGKIYPKKEVKLSVEVAGEVTTIHVKEGDSVPKGKLLMEINPDNFRSMVDQALASLNQTKANLSTSQARLLQAQAQFQIIEKDFNRKKGLLESGTIASAEFEQVEAAYLQTKGESEAAKLQVDASKYQVDNARASYNEANKTLNKTKLYAPMSGIVSKLNVELGERVVGTSQMAGTELVTIADLNDMEVQVDVGENDVLKLSIGDTALIEVDAYLNKEFKGIVSHIGYSSELNIDQVTKFKVKIDILKSSYVDMIKAQKYPFRPGMSSTVNIITNINENALSVPIQSVTTRRVDSLDKAIEVVFVTENEKAIQKEVTISIQDDEYIEITHGLSEGEKVISAPYKAISKDLEHEADVLVVDEDELFEK